MQHPLRPTFSAAAALMLAAALPRPATALSAAPLPIDQAFPSYANVLDQRIVVSFNVTPGHYLYREQFEATLDGKPVKALQLPQSQSKQDPYFGRVETYPAPFSLSLPAAKASGKPQRLVLHFQGCSETAGVCYPPTQRVYLVPADGSPAQPETPNAKAAAGTSSSTSSSGGSALSRFLRP